MPKTQEKVLHFTKEFIDEQNEKLEPMGVTVKFIVIPSSMHKG